MGQAFRRASGRIRSSALDTTPTPTQTPTPSSSCQIKKVVEARQPEVTLDKVSDGASRSNAENVLEERDPQYDAMLNQMMGRIHAKPGGKLEMGEAAVVEKYKRPLPKLRNTKGESGRYEESAVPPGTLNAVQLRQIVLLHEGKADDHDGPMDIHHIAQRFQIDVEQVQRIVQFLSFPPESTSSNQKKDQQ